MIIEVIVKTNQKTQSIKLENNIYKIGLKNKPINGKANLELLKLLKKHFKKTVKIISGLKSKKKRVELK